MVPLSNLGREIILPERTKAESPVLARHETEHKEVKEKVKSLEEQLVAGLGLGPTQEQPVFLKDAVGRKHHFPFEMARTWQVCDRNSSDKELLTEQRAYKISSPTHSCMLKCTVSMFGTGIMISSDLKDRLFYHRHGSYSSNQDGKSRCKCGLSQISRGSTIFSPDVFHCPALTTYSKA